VSVSLAQQPGLIRGVFEHIGDAAGVARSSRCALFERQRCTCCARPPRTFEALDAVRTWVECSPASSTSSRGSLASAAWRGEPMMVRAAAYDSYLKDRGTYVLFTPRHIADSAQGQS